MSGEVIPNNSDNLNENDSRILVLAYENIQGWIRHYDNVLFTLTFFVVSVCVGYAAIKIQKTNSVSFATMNITAFEVVEALFPISLVFLSLFATVQMDQRSRTAWRKIVEIENGLGFYKKIKAIDGAVLDTNYKESGKYMHPFFKMSYSAQFFAAVVPIIVIIFT